MRASNAVNDSKRLEFLPRLSPSAPAAPSAAAKWLEASPENASKCYYFESHGNCNKGKRCRFFAGSEGHNE